MTVKVLKVLTHLVKETPAALYKYIHAHKCRYIWKALKCLFYLKFLFLLPDIYVYINKI